jgi:serine protease Do
MIRNALMLLVLALSAGSLLFGQTPQAKKETEKAAKVFSFAFDDDGGYLGIQTAEVNKENFGKYGLRDVRGVAVEKVLEDSPAKAAGLQSGDVITRFNGEEITSVRKLTRLISEVAPDHQAKLTLLRRGSERDLSVTLGKRPTPKFADGNFRFGTPGAIEMPDTPDIPGIPQTGELPRIQIAPGDGDDMFVWRAGSSRQIGVSVSPLTRQLADHFGVAEGGLLINNVRENSPAAKAGLKAGDIITEVEGKAVKGDFDLIRAIGEKKEGDVELTVMRDRNRQTFRVTPEAFKAPTSPMLENFNMRSPMRLRLPARPSPSSIPAPMILGLPGSDVL